MLGLTMQPVFLTSCSAPSHPLAVHPMAMPWGPSRAEGPVPRREFP